MRDSTLLRKPRHETALVDFELSAELCRLMGRLDHIRNGTIERLEASVPGDGQRIRYRGRMRRNVSADSLHMRRGLDAGDAYSLSALRALAVTRWHDEWN